MISDVFSYPIWIKESYLDIFGHVNNAMYLTLFEEARWDIITQAGHGVNKIMETGIGPIILEIKLCFLRELRLREEIVIETQVVSYKEKTGSLLQKMLRASTVCCTAEIVFGFFDLKKRKLIRPSTEWLNALGIMQE